jgi:hypothetical protein
MRIPAFFVLAIAVTLSLGSSRSGAPLHAVAGQDLGAGAPGGAAPAPSTTGIPRQERAKRECGLNSLYLLLRLAGHDVTYDQTREAVAISSRGTSLRELQQAASRLGVRTRVSRCSMAELLQTPKPVIAYLRLREGAPLAEPGHYVVVLNADEAGVEVLDSAFAGSFKYPTSRWEVYWTGHILAPAAEIWTRPLTLTAVVGIWVALGLYCWRARFLRRAAAAHPTVGAQVEGA